MSDQAPRELDELLERSAELSAIRASAERAAAGQGRVLVVEGPAGIGKTALADAARAFARTAGLKPLAARGSELERAFGFGVVRQLLAFAVDAARPSAFTGAARQAAAVLDVQLPDAEPLPAGPEAAFAILHGLYRLTVNLAERQPLALVVDDAHWADAASLRFLSFLTGRLDGLPLLLLVAARPPGEPGGVAVAALLAEGASGERLRPRALTHAAAARLVRTSVPDAADDLCRTCHEITGGNPFFLRELATALRDAGPTDAAALLGAAPEGVVSAIRARLARFPQPARELAGAASILGDGALLRHAASICGLEEPVAAEAADALRAGRMLDAGRRLSFLHPIICSAVHDELTHAARSRGHRAAARLLAGEDAARERVAAHLLGAEPAGSDWVCDRLREAAREAVPRGAPEASVTYLRRALEEPPAPDARPAVLLELGLAEALTLDVESAITHLRRGVETTRDTPARLYAARMLSSLVGIDSPADGVEILVGALAASHDADPALLVHLEGHLVNIARFELRTRRDTARRAARLRERVEAGELDGAMELSVAATEATMVGAPADGAVRLAERAIAGLRAEPLLAITLALAVRCLAVADRLADAERVIEESLDEAQTRHATYRVAPLLTLRADVRLRSGALEDAESDATAALTIYRARGRMGALLATAALVQALTEQGKLAAAAAAVDAADPIDDSYPSLLLLYARGRLRLAQGDAGAALEDVLACGHRARMMGERNPALMEWRSQAALALARLGREQEAAALAGEELALARAFGAPRAIAIALRVSGIVTGGLALLQESVDVLVGSPAILERARSLAQLGIALRRRRRVVDAREPLRLALDLADRCGADPLAELAGAELRIAGARPRRAQLSGFDALTTNEKRVAAMAADGSSNREIAAALFVSHKTIEKHLTAAYRKLGIATRGELAGALAKE